MGKFFEQDKNLTALPTGDPDAKIIYIASTYIQYDELRLNDLYKQVS